MLRLSIFHISQRIQHISGSSPLYLNQTWSASYLGGTSGDSFLLRKELPSEMLLVDVLLRSNIFPLQHLVQRRGAILDTLFRISEGFYFEPHHLIMAALLYFEEKVHKKKLQRVDTIPLLFPRLLFHILEHMGYSTEPHLKHRHHCREHFTLDQWTQLPIKVQNFVCLWKRIIVCILNFQGFEYGGT